MTHDTSHTYEKEDDPENSPDLEKDTEYIDYSSEFNNEPEMNGGKYKHAVNRKKYTLKKKFINKKNVFMTKRKKTVIKRRKNKTKKNYIL